MNSNVTTTVNPPQFKSTAIAVVSDFDASERIALSLAIAHACNINRVPYRIVTAGNTGEKWFSKETPTEHIIRFAPRIVDSLPTLLNGTMTIIESGADDFHLFREALPPEVRVRMVIPISAHEISRDAATELAESCIDLDPLLVTLAPSCGEWDGFAYWKWIERGRFRIFPGQSTPDVHKSSYDATFLQEIKERLLVIC